MKHAPAIALLLLCACQSELETGSETTNVTEMNATDMNTTIDNMTAVDAANGTGTFDPTEARPKPANKLEPREGGQ